MDRVGGPRYIVPIVRVLILARPRSGSYWLCDLLAANGVMQHKPGAGHEPLNIDVLRRLPHRDFVSLIDAAYLDAGVDYQGTRVEAFKYIIFHLRATAAL